MRCALAKPRRLQGAGPRILRVDEEVEGLRAVIVTYLSRTIAGIRREVNCERSGRSLGALGPPILLIFPFRNQTLASEWQAA